MGVSPRGARVAGGRRGSLRWERIQLEEAGSSRDAATAGARWLNSRYGDSYSERGQHRGTRRSGSR
ncbi:hypothetical protein GCM10010469_29320 [Streptomyces labedae]|uniref:Uncharacterized protein n=1 Tax=Streptomyces labedae TaxID=285569 RepID=A0ABP6QWJ6_9ACTN|nr:hypothetical protein GCM10010265_38990 [Streptomyces griseoincarnatus]